MKFQIIQLDPSDDGPSISDKLSRVQAERTLLVWPRRGSPLTSSRLDLVLIQRRARDLGVQLGLLSHDPRVIDAARHLEIPLFDSVEQATQIEWPAKTGISYPRRPKTNLEDSIFSQKNDEPIARWSSRQMPNWLRYSLLLLATLALLALAAFLLPSATIEVEPTANSEEQSFTFVIVAGEAGSTADSIPSQLHQTSISSSLRIQTSGTSQVPAEFATGELTFTNLTADQVVIPSGTSVRTTEDQGIRFVTTELVELTAGQGNSSQVSAQAFVAGPEGNVEAETINAVDGPLGLQVQVSNQAEFSGGTNQAQAIVTQSDQDLLMADLEQVLLQLGRQKLADSLPPDQTPLDPSVQINEIVEVSFDAEPGEPAASLGLDLVAEVTGLAYSKADINSLLQRELNSRQGSLQLVPGSLRFSVDDTFAQDDHYGIEVQADWQEYQPVDPNSLSRALAGKPDEMDWQVIEEEYQVQVIHAQRNPSWFPTYPVLPNRIQIFYPWQAE